VASPDRLSVAQARRVALAAQGFGRPSPPGAVTRSHLRRVLAATGLLQIDSVNVLARAHYLPVFSRLGGYPRPSLDAMAYRHRELFEYWAHEASLVPVALHPLLRWRMHRARDLLQTWDRMARLAAEQPGYVAWALAEVADRGPLTAGELEARPARGTPVAPGRGTRGGWWSWGQAKTALEYLFWCGDVTTVTRRSFERVYDLTERVLPAAVLALPTPDEATAHRELLVRAAASVGVGTVADLADYYRLPVPAARPRVAELVEAGRLLPVSVEGWSQPAFLHPDARRPRQIVGCRVLAPFDPLVWFRPRVQRLFGFRYRIEIYTPAALRVHGYYVLPVLLDEALVARVDLKSDRAGGRLLVRSAHPEPGTCPDLPERLLAELRLLADWLGLDDVDTVDCAGELGPALRAVGLRVRG
jgi:uncharacterized protein YcaQ